MYILVDLTIRKAELADADDTRRFHVSAAHGDSADDVDAVLIGQELGYLDRDGGDDDDEHVWINADAVRELAEPIAKPGWGLHFDKMLASAKEHGYLSDDGSHIHAHVEWIDTDH